MSLPSFDLWSNGIPKDCRTTLPISPSTSHTSLITFTCLVSCYASLAPLLKFCFSVSHYILLLCMCLIIAIAFMPLHGAVIYLHLYRLHYRFLTGVHQKKKLPIKTHWHDNCDKFLINSTNLKDQLIDYERLLLYLLQSLLLAL